MIARNGRALAAALVAGLLMLLPAAALAQEIPALQARVRGVSFDSSGRTRIVVSVSGTAVAGATLDGGNFSLTENGEAIEALSAEPLFETGAQAVAVALLVDVSGSTRDKLEEAKAAAIDFVNRLPEVVRVGLISFGANVTTLSAPTPLSSARQNIVTQIQGLQPEPQGVSGTKLYDAVVEGADELAHQLSAQRNVVIFSDGGDVGSRSTLEQAVTAVKNIDAPVTTILLTTGGVNEQPMRALADAEKAGSFLRIEDNEQLLAAFGAVAQAITSQYVLTYASDDREPRELDLRLTVSVGSVTANDNSAVLNRRAATGPPPPDEAQGPLVGLFASTIGFYIGVAAAFAGIALFVGMIFWAPSGRRAERMLQRRLRLYSRSERAKEKQKQDRASAGGVFGSSALGRRAVELAERVPRSKQFDQKMQGQLDKAGWPIRTTEFVLVQVGAAVLGFAIGAALFKSLWFGLVIGLFSTLIPRVVLSNRIAKRSSDFLSQLPDTLQLLAGSLQAGYGFLQALDTVAKEAIPPTSSEFSRVLSEARLGMPVEDALDDMADRVGGEDFKWVVLAINIQRQVGGNLAQLLTTVAQTLREREQVRRQIKVLSAEGRLSAVILIALPFVLFGYLRLLNPVYISQLTSHSVGKLAILVGLGLITIGAAWMRKIIRIEV